MARRSKSDVQGIPVSPLTGILDARSQPDQMQEDSLRMRQNLRTVGAGKLRRGTGWAKLLDQSNYNNSDFHDQLLTFTPSVPVIQPPTLLFEAVSTRKVRSLFLATQGKIAKLNAASGNWQIIGSGFGGKTKTVASAPRFKAAQLGDFVAFTNDFDKPMYHELESNPVSNPSLIQPFADLDTIGLSRARVVWQWSNCLFIADVTMDGQRFCYRLLWSDFENPISFDPAVVSSITGTKDLYTYERILAGRPSGNSFLIYTTHGIWQMDVVGGAQSFAFTRVYNGEEDLGSAVLKYPNTLVQLPDAHCYMAEDGVYFFNQFYGKPERVEWLHSSTPLIYDKINVNNCDVHVGHFSDQQVYFSVAQAGAPNDAPNVTLRVNTQYRVADLIDHGFTAFCNFQPDLTPTIRDFIIDNAICTAQTLVSKGYGWVNEGLPNPIPQASAPFAPICFYTTETVTIDGVTTENWNALTADPHSLCFLLGDERVDDICLKCQGATLLVAASSADWCLKQLTDEVFYRERCVNPTAVGATSSIGYASSVASYVLDGYDSIMRFAPAFNDKLFVELSDVKLDYLAADAAQPASIGLRVGISGQPGDPNTDKCGIVWFQHSFKLLKCLTQKTADQHRQQNTIPADYAHWVLIRQGRYIYLELKVSGTGGDATFSRVTADVRLKEARNY